MTFYGANTQQLTEYGTSLDNGAVRVEELIDSLQSVVHATEWIGPDADRFREEFQNMREALARAVCDALRERARTCEENAEEQDEASDPKDPSLIDILSDLFDHAKEFLENLWEWLKENNPLDDYQPLESDGFWSDLFGENGLTALNVYLGVSSVVDFLGLLPIPGLTQVGLVNDAVSAEIAKYDLLQSFQDGELFNSVDAAVTLGINGLDIAAAGIATIPHPATVAAGEALGIATGLMDLGWNGLTALSANSGLGDGSPSRMLFEAPGTVVEAVTGWDGLLNAQRSVADGMENAYSEFSEGVRDAVPILDPLIDIPQRGIEAIGSWFN